MNDGDGELVPVSRYRSRSISSGGSVSGGTGGGGGGDGAGARTVVPVSTPAGSSRMGHDQGVPGTATALRALSFSSRQQSEISDANVALLKAEMTPAEVSELVGWALSALAARRWIGCRGVCGPGGQGMGGRSRRVSWTETVTSSSPSWWAIRLVVVEGFPEVIGVDAEIACSSSALGSDFPPDPGPLSRSRAVKGCRHSPGLACLGR